MLTAGHKLQQRKKQIIMNSSMQRRSYIPLSPASLLKNDGSMWDRRSQLGGPTRVYRVPKGNQTLLVVMRTSPQRNHL